jgi:hypothetical protein
MRRLADVDDPSLADRFVQQPRGLAKLNACGPSQEYHIGEHSSVAMMNHSGGKWTQACQQPAQKPGRLPVLAG